MRSSRSCAICAGWTFDRPLRASRGLQRGEPVARGVERVEAAGVAHRRAERQRLAAGAGAEVDHHLAALGVRSAARAAGCLRPAPRPRRAAKTSSLLQRRLAVDAQAPAANTASAAASMPAAPARACTSSRLALSVLTRRSSGAGCVQAVDQRPELVAELRLQRLRPASRAGCGAALGQRARGRSPAPAASQLLLVRARARARRKPSLPCQPRIARRRSHLALAGLRQVLRTAGAGAARRRSSRPARGARARRARDARGRRRRRRRRPAARSAARRCSSSVGQLEQGVRMHRRIILAAIR